ncbi:MAG: alpha-1,4-glucan--maltose-1-phosphate maltosyltransferase [Chthoniobacterales bacterium]
MSSLFPTVVIENLWPRIEDGKYPIKRTPGEEVTVYADIFKEGHDVVLAVVKWRPAGAKKWQEAPMTPIEEDRWRGSFPAGPVGFTEWTIESWGDAFGSWVEEIGKKARGGATSLPSETLEGAALVRAAARRAGKNAAAKKLSSHADRLEAAPDPASLVAAASDAELITLMGQWPDRSLSTTYAPSQKVRVDRKGAAFAAWYEFFPRSAEGKAGSGSTFRDCLGRVDDAKAMGFDVIYFPPIHPIGITARKGANNSLTCKPGEPGVPYAIGGPAGGHCEVEPELGTMADFEWLLGEIRARGMEVALDFALNCSPDHPYVKDHPEWFFHRPDGTIKYAENPPKKYEDVYPLDYHNAGWKALWEELRDVLLFWAGMGVRIFRVDNPHTKPVAFWEWAIAEVQAKFPDVIFLSEAFTRPKMMRSLAKVGFTQSYTYFTWRNSPAEIEEYFTELTRTPMREYFRPNLFPNTPDILPVYLQEGGRPAFMIRAVLATTLSGVYGIYSGFELCENAALPGREEYLDSEKYQYKQRDWNAPGNIKPLITRLNAIRRENAALQQTNNLAFFRADNPALLCYRKWSQDGSNQILVIVTTDFRNGQGGWIDVPTGDLGLSPDSPYQVEDLLTGEVFSWRGVRNFVSFDPSRRIAHILCVRK